MDRTASGSGRSPRVDHCPNRGHPYTPRPHFKRHGIMTKQIKKAVLAYSGGLDTSVILKWLQDDLQL